MFRLLFRLVSILSGSEMCIDEENKKPFRDCDGDCLACDHFENDCEDYAEMAVWEDLLYDDDED